MRASRFRATRRPAADCRERRALDRADGIFAVLERFHHGDGFPHLRIPYGARPGRNSPENLWGFNLMTTLRENPDCPAVAEHPAHGLRLYVNARTLVERLHDMVVEHPHEREIPDFPSGLFPAADGQICPCERTRIICVAVAHPKILVEGHFLLATHRLQPASPV